jgi:enediyne biosynthesis protein E4
LISQRFRLRKRLHGSRFAHGRISPALLVVVALAATTTLLVRGETGTAAAATQAPPTVRFVPDGLQDTSWLQTLRDAQVKAAEGVTAFHDFQFTDRQVESGITFRHRIVDDAGKAYKAVHYDHGNGVAIADVDGDGLLDIYFVNQVGGNQIWRNLGGGRFQDITASAGVAVPGKISVAASFADIDNDGDPDLYVTTVRGGNMLFENDGHGRFQDISAASGLNYVGHSSAAVFFDYNHDGRLDLFLVNVGRYTNDTIAPDDKHYVGLDDAFSGHLKPERAEQSILYRNEGGNRFVDVSQRVGLQDMSWSGDASVVDVNDDGWPDLYVLNMQGNDQYYENVGGTRFVKKSRVVFPRTSWGSMGIKVFDFNNDGRLDIFVTDMHSDMSEEIGPERDHMKSDMHWPVSFRGNGKASIWGNSFFLKEGPGKFREVSDAIGLENYCPWGPSVGDLNADGYDDAFIASGMNYPFRYMVNSLKLNERGQRFVDAEFVLGIEPRKGGVATPWFELDASGADKGHRDAEGMTGRVAVWGARGTRSAAIFDVDGDGDLDIVTNEFNTVPMVLISNLTEKTQVHYLEVKLTGTTSNRDGLGAVVKVTAGGATYTKVLDGNSGYLSHSVYPLYFGLGAAGAVDRIEILWPSGKKQTVQPPIKINSRIEVREP